MNLKQFIKPSSENLTASGNSAFCKSKRLSNFYYWVKPDWRKILIFIVLSAFFLSFLLNINTGDIFFQVKGFPFPIETSLPIETTNFSWRRSPRVMCYLIIDLIFWYFISCFIIWIYDKVKKKEVRQINS